ncbi:MAG: GTPase Era, partial [Acidobacteriaceae bacterium]|nr:GTPase Era [Acidobacteriaceae bacterium]
DKPQTTRTAIQGVVTLPQAQLIFIDTPGIHDAKTLINERMMESVRAALDGRDLVLFLVDCSVPFQEQDEKAVELVKVLQTPVFLVLNKIDRVQNKQDLLPRLERYRAMFEFAEYFSISAMTGEGLPELRDAIIARLPEGPRYFPADYLTDQPERFIAAELIRERILHETRQEVPHSVAVIVEKWEDTPRLVRINATIYVERSGQKAIIIGAKGALLKTIGTAARQEIETLLSKKVFLELFVKVRPAWRESSQFLDAIDWRSMHGGQLEVDPENNS